MLGPKPGKDKGRIVLIDLLESHSWKQERVHVHMRLRDFWSVSVIHVQGVVVVAVDLI